MKPGDVGEVEAYDDTPFACYSISKACRIRKEINILQMINYCLYLVNYSLRSKTLALFCPSTATFPFRSIMRLIMQLCKIIAKLSTI